ncbi:MAG: B-box zinc finger protein [Terriglobales bacterium]
MNCVVHPDVAATAYCRTCGKALCERCAHNVRGVVYCEDCIATRLHDTVPPAPAIAPGIVGAAPAVTRTPSPGLAAFLGLIPFGLGAFYNGQFIKGIVHAFVFIGLCYGASTTEGTSANIIFGMLIPVWILYMAFDAHQTAKAISLGQPAPDPLGLDRAFVGTDRVDMNKVPMGAIILIGLGLLFLVNTMGWFHMYWLHHMWPIVLIVIGVWMFMKRYAPPPGGVSSDSGGR